MKMVKFLPIVFSLFIVNCTSTNRLQETNAEMNFSRQPASLKKVSCWNGFNQGQQDANLKICTLQKKEGQKCSTNIWEHEQAAYDVCMMESSGELRIVTIYKGFNNAEQKENLSICKKQESAGKICVTSMFVHKQAAFDVALMENVTQKKESAPEQNVATDTTPSLETTNPTKKGNYRGYGNQCRRVDKHGTIYGAAVDETLCQADYKGYGNQCRRVDKRGTIYGAAVKDDYCHADYRGYGNQCRRVDRHGTIYGSAVADKLCE